MAIHGEATDGSIIDIGPGQMEKVFLPAFNELPQVRTSYDETGIRELAGAILSGHEGEVSSDTFKLLSPPSAGLFTRREAELYINDHGEFYEIPSADRTDVANLTPYDDEHALILIAGHRRKRAIYYQLGRLGVDPARVRLLTALHPGVEFADAIALQLRENTYEKPPAWDEARAIELSYRRQQALTGSSPNIRELAKYLGFSETKVREALQFVSLPKSIQAFAQNGMLSYTVVRSMKPLYDAYLQRYKYLPQGTRIESATAELEAFCNVDICKYLEGKKDDRISALIANKLAALRREVGADQSGFEQDELFFFQDGPVERARESRRQLASVAIRVVQHSVGQYSEAQLAAMQTAIDTELAMRNRAQGRSEFDIPIF